jgi:hypothetical protein
MKIHNEALKYWNSKVQSEYQNPFTDLQIKNIEQLVSKKLPDDFVSFLKQYAGVDTGIGRIDEPIAFFVAKVLSGTKFFAGVEVKEYATGIDSFATFDEMAKAYNILTRIPDYMLPINTENSMLLIDLSEDNYGSIWLWLLISVQNLPGFWGKQR